MCKPVDEIRMKPRLSANIAGILSPIPQQSFSVVVNRSISAISEPGSAWFRLNFGPSNELTFSSIDTL